MKILIIDNEADLRLGLHAMIQESEFPNIQIDEADGVQTGFEKIKSFEPDIVFLDVEMNDGTGFDLLTHLHQLNFQLIFTTAHNKYAIDAFRFSAIDFLLKPIDPEELYESIARASENIRKENLDQKIQVLMQQISSNSDGQKKIVLNDKRNTYFVKVSDILYCEAESTYTKFFILNESPIVVSKTMKEYDELLQPYGFIRTHHSYLVNAKKIKLLDKKDGGTLILEGGQHIPISQRKKEQVMYWLERN